MPIYLSIDLMRGNDPNIEKFSVEVNSGGKKADYETHFGLKCVACCFMDENNISSDTNFSVKLAETLRH